MGVEFSDLPPEIQRQLRDKHDLVKRSKPSRSDPLSVPCPYRCLSCPDLEFPTYLAAEKHLDLEHGSGMLRMVS